MEKDSRLKELLDDIKVVKKIAKFFWNNRKTYIKYSLIGFVVALVVAFSIPKTYSTTVLLAPEIENSDLLSGASNITSALGMNLGNMSEDAYTIDLYPTIVSSLDFIHDLHNIKVRSAKREIDTTYSDYLRKYQRIAWWEYPVVWLNSLIAVIIPVEQPVISDAESKGKNSNIRMLTKEEYGICMNIQGKIRCSVDQITGVIIITAEDQDPEISATVADTVVNRLSRFILEYRTRKARNDYSYISTLCDTAKNTYIQAQKRYADFVTKHTNVYSQIHKAEMQALENEVSLAFSSYSSIAAQQQLALAKIMEKAPVYTTIESPYIPIFADSPKKLFIVLMFVIFACIVASIKLVYVKIEKKGWKKEQA